MMQPKLRQKNISRQQFRMKTKSDSDSGNSATTWRNLNRQLLLGVTLFSTKRCQIVAIAAL